MIKMAESKTAPKRLISIGEKVHYTFDIQSFQKDGETHYRYSYVEIDGELTKEKIFAARKASEATISESNAAAIDAEFDLIVARLTEIGQLTWAQVDSHVDTVFSGLTTAQKTSLKMIYKCVLALIKLGP